MNNNRLSSSKIQAKRENEKANRATAEKDAPKDDKEAMSKRQKRKDASDGKEKGTKPLSIKKPKRKPHKTKSSKTNGKKASHPQQSRTDKILHKLKPQTKGTDDRNHSASIKDRIVEVNVGLAQLLIFIELLSSIIWFSTSIILEVFGASSFPYFLVSVAAFISTFPGALVLYKCQPEQGIGVFSIGQLVCGFFGSLWIAVVWFDLENYTEEIVKATYFMEVLVIYQFIATILTSWRPYREVKFFNADVAGATPNQE